VITIYSPPIKFAGTGSFGSGLSRFLAKIARHEPPFSTKKLLRLGCFANFYFVVEFFDAARQALRGSLLAGAGEMERFEIAIRYRIA
jgi:hypothetical protein